MSDADSAAAPADADGPAADAILAIAREIGPAKTLSPMDAALRLAPGEGWQRALPEIRKAAIQLALQGRLIIYRKGKPVDPHDFRGVYRLGLPRDE